MAVGVGMVQLSLEKFDKLSEEFLHVGFDSVELLESE